MATKYSDLGRTLPIHGTVRQRGVFLLEALIALLIFAFGILGIVAMGASAINAQSDAQYRSEAASYASELVGQMWMGMDRSSSATIASSLATFSHQPTGDPATCAFSGTASTNTVVTGWVNRISTVSATNKGLPGSTAVRQQVTVATDATSGVTTVSITICWQSPSDAVARRLSHVAFIS